MSLLAALANLPVDFTVPLDGDKPVPMIGDRAFTWYHGVKYVGRLESRHRGGNIDIVRYDQVESSSGTWNAEQWGGPHGENYIWVGYDGPIQWDAEAEMWAAPADSD